MITLMFCSNQMQMFPTDTSHLASADKVTLRKQLESMMMDSDEHQDESNDGDKERRIKVTLQVHFDLHLERS